MSYLGRVGWVVGVWLVIALLVSMLAGCAVVKKSGALVASKTELSSELPAAERLFVDAKERFNAKRDGFTADELVVIDRGIAQIEQGTAAMRDNFKRGGVSEAVAFVRFIGAWSDVKEGFLLSSGVIGSKDLTAEDRVLLDESRETVNVLDRVISSMTPGEDDAKKYQAAADLVGAAAMLIKAVKKDE